MIRVLLIGMLIVICGCTGFKDIDKRFFVLAIGVDKTGDQSKPYRITLKLGIPSPKIEPGQSNKYELISQDADSIQEAIRLIKSKVDKELDFGHAKVYVFGKSLASESIREPLDWFVRRRDIQLIGFAAIGEPSAKAVLNTSPKSERLPANSLILSFDQEGTESSFIVTESLSDFYRRLTERGKDPYMPIIRVHDNSFTIDQVAVFDKERLKVVLSPDQTRVFNELVRSFNKFDNKTSNQQLRYNIATHRAKTKFSLYNLKGGDPKIHVELNMVGQVEESTMPLYNRDWKELEKMAEDQVKARITSTLTSLQKNNVDPVGFGLRYRAMGYGKESDWEKWTDLYPRIPFEVNVKLMLIGTGVIK